MSLCGSMPQARAWRAVERPISPPSSVTALFRAMFWGLNGATEMPWRWSQRHRAATMVLLPESEVVPMTISDCMLQLHSFLGAYAEVLEGVFDDGHVGDGVGQVDEFFGGVAAGDDDVLHVGAVLEVVQDLVEVEVFVAQGDVEFVEQDQAVAVVLEHAGDFFPGVFGGFDVFSRSCVSQV